MKDIKQWQAANPYMAFNFKNNTAPKMKIFNVLIYKQNRILLSILIFILLMFPVFLLPTHINNSLIQWTSTILGLLGLVLILRYFSVSRLFVTFRNNKLSFEWDRKLLFNYRKIPTIEIQEIRRIVLDDGSVLRKIITDKEEITLGHGKPNKYFKSDSQKFINFLRSEVTNLEIVDSWDIWVEKGYFKWALRINTAILIMGILIILTYIILKGFNSRHLFIMIFILPQMLLYQMQMKSKIK